MKGCAFQHVISCWSFSSDYVCCYRHDLAFWLLCRGHRIFISKYLSRMKISDLLIPWREFVGLYHSPVRLLITLGNQCHRCRFAAAASAEGGTGAGIPGSSRLGYISKFYGITMKFTFVFGCGFRSPETCFNLERKVLSVDFAISYLIAPTSKSRGCPS